MSHHIYQSPAFVLESRNSRERDKSVLVFVRELGVLRAMAQGVRDIKSKLRSGLVEMSLVHMSLVRGKEMWRVVNLAPSRNFYYELKDTPTHLYVVTRIASALKRLMKGEEKNVELFDVIESFCNIIGNFPEKKCKALESLVMLRIMHNLGYIGETKVFHELISTTEWNESLLELVEKEQNAIIKEINRALKESSL